MYYNYCLLNPLKPGKYSYSGINMSFLYEPFYIGKGKNLRYRDHWYESNINDTIKGKIIRKILYNNLEPLVIFINKDLNEKEAFDNEIKIISIIGRKKLNTGPLSNLTDGGDGPSGFKFSKESLEKSRIAHLGYKAPQSQKDNISKANKGKIRTIEHCIKYSNQKIVIQTDEMKQRISNSLKGKNFRIKLTNESFKVNQIDPITNLVLNTFLNSVEASKYLTGNNSVASSIRKACKGLRKISKGFKWEYNYK